MTHPLRAVSLAEAHLARARITGTALRTPLIRLPADAGDDVHLKLENLQPIGSFKIRGAANAMAIAGPESLENGVYTASAGNMAQGVAWCARMIGVRCQVVVPDHAPKAKIDAIKRLGGEVIKVPFEAWWQTILDHRYPGMEGIFIHPFADEAVMAGNGTIALEIFEDLEEVESILVPYGGGGLACGIAAVAAVVSPHTRVFAVEVETAAPLTATFAAGEPTPVTYARTFIDGMGSGGVSREMWPLGVHVAHLMIDADIQELNGKRQPHPQSCPSEIAESVLSIHRQPRTAWSSELDLRPWNESFWNHC